MKNLDLLTRVRDQIIMEPKKHHQSTWATVDLTDEQVEAPLVMVSDEEKDRYSSSIVHGAGTLWTISCATTACVAGHATMLAGDVAVIDEANRHSNFDRAVGGDCVCYHVLTPEGQVRLVEPRAEELLGLSHAEGYELFEGTNSREQVLDLLDRHIKDAEKELEEAR